eukprot:UN12768
MSIVVYLRCQHGSYTRRFHEVAYFDQKMMFYNGDRINLLFFYLLSWITKIKCPPATVLQLLFQKIGLVLVIHLIL